MKSQHSSAAMSINPETSPRASRLNKPGHLILIGMMGSGKTSVGQTLSKLTHLPFLDSDQAIETEKNRSVADIFATHGEATWRAYEVEFCKTLPHLLPQVIATGGGLILNPENTKLLQKNGTVIWLNTSLNTLQTRLENDTQRPLLTQDKNQKLATLLDQRSPLYKHAADFEIQTDTLTPEEIAEKIVQLMVK